MELVLTRWRRLWLCYRFFSKPFDFINISQKLAYKVKYIGQINRGLIMFFANSRISFLKLVGSIMNIMERIYTKKKKIQST